MTDKSETNVRSGGKRAYDAKYMLQLRESCKEVPETVETFRTSFLQSGGSKGTFAHQFIGSISTGTICQNDCSIPAEPTRPNEVASDVGSSPAFAASDCCNTPVERHPGRPQNIGQIPDMTEKAQTLHYDTVMKTARGILNKLTPTTLDKLSNDLAMLDIKDARELEGASRLVFDMCIQDERFCDMYANLCCRIRELWPRFHDSQNQGALPQSTSAHMKPLTFQLFLISKCQEEFERVAHGNQSSTARCGSRQKIPDGVDAPQHAAAAMRARRRRLCFFKFLAELAVHGFLHLKIMHDCIASLLPASENEADIDRIEGLCKLLATVGKLMDHARDKDTMDNHFDKVISPEIRLMPCCKMLKIAHKRLSDFEHRAQTQLSVMCLLCQI